MMKRLFMLRHGRGGSPVRDDKNEVLYFGSKPEAKKIRDLHNGAVVSYGPDHNKYQHGGR